MRRFAWGGLLLGGCLIPNPNWEPAGDGADAPAADDTSGTSTVSGGVGGGTDVAPGTSVATSLDPPEDGTEDGSENDVADLDGDGPATDSGVPGDWWDADWAYRRRVIWAEPDLPFVSHLAVRVDIVDSPRGAAPTFDGRDIRFVTTSGEVLDFEIDHWQQGQAQGSVWVSVPAAGGEDPTEFWVYFGNENAPPVGNGGGSAVWSETYSAVWHLENEVDSTGNQHDLATVSTQPDAGLIGGGFVSAKSDVITVGSSAGLDGLPVVGMTFSAWLLLPDSGSGGVVYEKMLTETSNGTRILLQDGASPSVILRRFATGPLPTYEVRSVVGVNTGDWHQLVVTHVDGLETRMWIDGVEKNTEVDIPLEPTGMLDTGQMVIGGSLFDADDHPGARVDEVRIASAPLTPDRIVLDHRATSGSLVDLGPVEFVED